MGWSFSLSDLNPIKAVKEFLDDPLDAIGDLGTSLYGGLEKGVSNVLRETFSLLGFKGKTILAGDVSTQLLSKDERIAHNLLVSEIIKKQTGQTATPQFIMNILLAGRFVFQNVYRYGRDEYSKGLPTYYVVDAVDANEEGNATNIAEALKGSGANIVEAAHRSITEEEYMYSCLLAYYDYSPEDGTIEYNDTRYILDMNKTEHAEESYRYGTLYRVIMQGVAYATVTYTADRAIRTTILSSAIPDKDEVTTTNTLTFKYYALDTLINTHTITETSTFSLVDSGTGVVVEDDQEGVYTGSFIGSNSLQTMQTVNSGTVNKYIASTYVHEEDVTTTEMVQVGTDEDGNPIMEEQEVTTTVYTNYSKVSATRYYSYNVRNIRANDTINAFTISNTYVTSRYYLEGSEPDLTPTEFLNENPVVAIPTTDSVDITRSFTDVDACTYVYSNAYFLHSTKFSVVKFYTTSEDHISTFCYSASFDDLNNYTGIPTLSGLLSTFYSKETNYTLPIIPIRRDSVWLEDYEPSFKEEVETLLKKINIVTDDIVEDVKANVNSDNVTDTFIYFAVHPGSVSDSNMEVIGKYLWGLLESIEASIINIPDGSSRIIGFSVEADRYNSSLTWEYEGSKPYTGDMAYEYEVHTSGDDVIVRYNDGTSKYSKTMAKCMVTTVLSRGDEVSSSQKKVGDTGFCIPLISEYSDTLTPFEQVQLFSSTVTLSMFASELVDLEYYETTTFAGFVQFVAMSMMLVSFGATTKESGAMIALAKAATQIAISYGLKKALEYVYEQTDNEFIRSIASVTAVVATVYAGGKISGSEVVSLASFAGTMDIIKASAEIDLELKNEELEKERSAFEAKYEERVEQMEEITGESERTSDYMFVMDIKHSEWSSSLLSIDSYYNMALGEVDIDYDSQYTTLYDSYYGDKLQIGSK